MRIENWSMTVGEWDGYTAPERMEFRLLGRVYGHSAPDRHPDGKEIVTSPIVGKHGDRVCTHSGSEYELGEPHPEYGAQFPGAKERLLARLNEVAPGPKE